MKVSISKSIYGTLLFIVVISQPGNGQSSISGKVFYDQNNNNSYDNSEGIYRVTLWLMNKAAVSPYYLVYPVQTAVSAADGSFSFLNVSNGEYQIRIDMVSLSSALVMDRVYKLTRSVIDNNSSELDVYPDGITDVSVTTPGSSQNIEFGFQQNDSTLIPVPQKRFSFNTGSNSLINVTSRKYDLDTMLCNGVTYHPSLTISTDRQCIVSGQTYPQAGNRFNPNGVDWPGPNKGGFFTDDVTLQLFFGFNCFNPFNNDRATVTLQFSNLVSNVRFSVYDIDDINPQLVDGSVDHVKVTGYNGVNPVDPIIRLDQNTPFNTISGNTVFGWPDYPDNNPINNYPDYFNSGNADNGNADFYFTSPVDRIVIEYEEYVKQLIPSAKKISVPVSPITNEFQWNLPAVPATRSISIGSIGYDYYCPAVLAANFLSFDAKANRIEVNLQWKTANDQQTRQYNIERLMPNGSWKEIGSIMQGQGPLYHYTDKQPVTGINQYRLVLVNTDGTRQFSEIRKVKITCNSNDMEITFNPGASLIVTLYGEARSLSVFNASGQCLFVQPVLPVNSNTGNVRISLDQFHPLPGLYIIKASFVNGEEKTLKFQAN